MATQHRVGTVATSVRRDDKGILRVTYHHTVVVTAKPNGQIILDHNGWKTATTKTRMNQASNQFGLGYIVYQTKGHWFVRYKGREVPFDKTPLTIRT